MEVSEWGPAAWTFLHASTFAVPKQLSSEQQHAFKTFFTYLPEVLPCAVCREHYKQYVSRHPIQTSTREELSKWLVGVHNNVNAITKKQLISFESACRKYSYTQKKPTSNRKWATRTLQIVVAVVVLVGLCIVIALMVQSCKQHRCPLNR